MPKTVRLYLVRHGEATSKWTEADDPGLSDLGRAQANGAASLLSAFGPLPVKSSPLLRARETAAPLSARWKSSVDIIPAVSEIPSPGIERAERQRWLLQVMAGGWGAAGGELLDWRAGLIETLQAQKEDCVIFSHFVAINAAVGAASGIDDVISFRPDNGSITILETDGGALHLIERGREAETAVR
ncbi:MAG: histidine phosphatase family protein [Parvularculaceae bacterium]